MVRRECDRHYVGGEWVPSSGDDTIDVVNASTEEVIGHVPSGTEADANNAVSTARDAFASWSTTTPAERVELLEKIKAGIKARSDELTEMIAAELGAPLAFARKVHVALPSAVTGSMIKLLSGYAFEETLGNSQIVKEPVGVVGCITPWNFPLHQVMAKVAPALAAGCTVVLKPSELAPFSAVILAEIADEAGCPAGVFNLVNGLGPIVGEAIACHAGVDMVTFTGSTRAGRRVSELAARTVKRVTLELGGKSANVILDDADLTKAVTAGVESCFFNSGQTCSSLTRMLVPAAHQDEAVAIAKRVTEGFKVGDPLEADTRLGPLISADQRERVNAYIKRGIEEGATLVIGGASSPDGLQRGYYVQPTVFSDVDNNMTIAQEEIFGPVLCIIPYGDEADAIQIANDTPYGLSGAVWSADQERALSVARQLRTGQVDINGGAYNLLAPFGGYKQSGHGREMGRYGLEEYLEIKSLQI